MSDTKILPRDLTVIIIGAGASGLMAARQLSEEGVRVVVLEADDKAGGRIQTWKEAGFSIPAEAGAEFIHGQLPVTLGLLQEAGIEFNAIAGGMKTVRYGKWLEKDPMEDYWSEMMGRMNELKEDITVDQFMEKYFPDPRYAPLRNSMIRFAEGFDLAETGKVSVLSLKEEWADEFEDDQYRITGGYSLLVDYLVGLCREKGVEFHFSTQVAEVDWSTGKVLVRAGDQVFEAARLLISVSAGIMQSGKIHFNPEPPGITSAFNDIGYGTVIKFLLEFSEMFWVEKLGDNGFVLSDELIPTWWTQSPGDAKLLTGWLGGPSVLQRSASPDAALLDLAIDSLAAIFAIPPNRLKDMLIQYRIVDWTKNPFTLGGYSYSTPKSADARTTLNRPVDNTLFFTGEALYHGKAPGTVEAALVAGEEAAVRILGS